jgi:hypothetical protein
MLDWLFGRKAPPAASVPAAPLSLDWVSVTSSNVQAIAYRAGVGGPARQILAVRFRNGSEYHYYDVPLADYLDMLAASSKGRFVWSRLRDQYPFERVR